MTPIKFEKTYFRDRKGDFKKNIFEILKLIIFIFKILMFPKIDVGMYSYNMFFRRFRIFEKSKFSIHENFYLRRKQYLTQFVLKKYIYIYHILLYCQVHNILI